ncbi:hypothetical protein ACFP51_31985 [Streptomyces pratens]|uniref:Uncharacterized protein n=1 Tax=Streptomyces pratens TaxID=887456 RepID=A0ABW1LWF9_9ACTN
MVRRSQTSNPRSAVVLTSGTDWHGRAASQRRSSGAAYPLPKKQAEKIQALQRAIKILQMASATKHRSEARYLFSRARALVEALPASQTVQERRQLSELRKKFGVGGKAAPKSSKKPKPNPVLKSYVPPKPKPQPAPKPDLVPKPKPKSRRRAKRGPFHNFDNRYIDRAALGYGPTDETEGSRTR